MILHTRERFARPNHSSGLHSPARRLAAVFLRELDEFLMPNNIRPSWARAFFAVATFACSIRSPASFAADNIIPGTKLLTIEEPLDEVMVAGIDRFAMKELAMSPARRDQAWQRDFSGIADYKRSIAAGRARFRE